VRDLEMAHLTACGSAAGPGTAAATLGSYGPDVESVSPNRSKRLLCGPGRVATNAPR